MRLTLRTLLAYMDEMLEPSDAEELGKKIEESEFASGLTQRIRDCMRQLRLGAPRPSGRGAGLDPNTVAEYLDNTLPAERIPDFERVCLESDVHLAEVASAHQILALVLGEPAAVDPTSRRRMYKLPARYEQAEAATESAEPVQAATNGAAAHLVTPAEVPDYLRRPAASGNWRKQVGIAGLLVAAALAIVAVWMAVNPPGWWRGDVAAGPVKGAGENAATPIANDEPATASSDAASADADRATSNGDSAPGAATGDESTGDESTTDADTDDEGSGLLIDSGDGEATGGTMPDGAVDEGDAATGTAADESVADNAANSATTTNDGAAAAVGAVPAGEPIDLGRLVSSNALLLRQGSKAPAWERLANGGVVKSGDRLVALPAMRSTVTLGAGISLELIGAAQVAISSNSAEDDPQIAIEYGRVMMLNVGKPENRVRLTVGGRTGTLVFGGAEAAVAAHVSRSPVAGVDPETNAPSVTVDLYATSGKFAWLDDPAGAPQFVQAPARFVVVGAVPGPEQGVALPPWIGSDDSTQIERRAVLTIREHLEQDRPMDLSLRELAQHRRSEVKAMAVRSAGLIGVFDPYVDALLDVDQRAFWDDEIASLRASMARGPEMATSVKAAFEAERGGRADELYRMLWGYTQEQLRGEDGAKLIAYLDHEDLDYRVLAFWNLRSATGFLLSYRPQDSAEDRRRAVQNWRQRYESGQLFPATEE